ncbi:hypothetical protein [Brachybacterium phenoliresistens]|uniref:hypothetical protein n=1 Tax=Brachybacterium phenoliresistens TaxID=396014 RepID=UPI0031DA219D
MTLVTVIPGSFTASGLPSLGVKGFADTFTRPDAASLGDTEGMPRRSWSVWTQSGTFAHGVTNGEGYAYRSDTAGHTLATVDAEAADGTLELTMGTRGASAQHGAVFRATDIGNYYRLVDAQGAEYRLQRFIGGAVTLLGAAAGVTPAAGDVLRIVLDGPSIAVHINGVQRITASDTHNQVATRHGFYNNAQGSTIRDISFTV